MTALEIAYHIVLYGEFDFVLTSFLESAAQSTVLMNGEPHDISMEVVTDHDSSLAYIDIVPVRTLALSSDLFQGVSSRRTLTHDEMMKVINAMKVKQL